MNNKNVAYDWQRLETLFHHASELPATERTLFITQQTEDNLDLRAELLKMLSVKDSFTELIMEPLHQSMSLMRDAMTLEEGSRFGPWAIVRPIGHGGMGQVYLAHRADGAYEREVALKLLSSLKLSPRQLALFDSERHALAQMIHPGIAQIHDAGTDENGRPWLVMEYIKGQSIIHYCESRQLSLNDRIQLFIRVTEGVLHAHQKGIVHRDIKPDNILVTEIDGLPAPKLIDFGIAIGDGDHGDAAGTPNYMSPEQLDTTRAVDIRSDVYSLGALLFELIIGQRPNSTRNSGEAEVAQRLSDISATDLQALANKFNLPYKRFVGILRNDLDWIVLKAMSRRPEERYNSVNEFSTDLTRYLKGYAPLAAQPNNLILFTKFLRRNRAATTAAMVILLALIGGLISTTLAMKRAEHEATRAQVTADFLKTLLSSVDPQMARDLDTALLLRVLDKASNDVATQLANYPLPRLDVEMELGKTYTALIEDDKALAHYNSVIAIADKYLGQGSLHALEAKQLAGTILSFQSLDEGTRALEEALALGKKFNPRHPLTANAQIHLANTLIRAGKINQGLRLAQQGYDTLLANTEASLHQRTNAAATLSRAHSFVGDYDKAVALINEAIGLLLETFDENHPEILRLRSSLSLTYLEMRDFAQAEQQLKSILLPAEAQFGQQSHFYTTIRSNLASALRQQGKIEEAGPHYQATLAFQLKEAGEEGLETIMARHNHANWLLDSGQVAEALSEQHHCIQLALKVFGDNSNITAEIYRGLGLAQLASEQLAEARQSLMTSQAIMHEVFGKEAEGPLARLNQSIKKLEEAEADAQNRSLN